MYTHRMQNHLRIVTIRFDDGGDDDDDDDHNEPR